MAKKPDLAALKSALGKEKFKHGSASVIFTAVFIAVIIVVNVLVSVLTTRFPSLNFDMTREGLNTLSEDSLEVAHNVEMETTIYLIGSEEAYRDDQIYSSYGLQYSQIANLAERLREANRRIDVQFIDPDLNPQFISQYSENLYSGSIVVQTDRRHKVLDVNDLFGYNTNSNTGETNYYSKADGALANAIYLVNLDNVPVVAFATGHSEMLTESNLSSFTGLLEDNNFEVKTFDFLLEEIPEDASIVFFGVPTTDFTSEEITKLDKFLSEEPEEGGRDNSRTLFFAAYPTQNWEQMKNLASFLEEWGLRAQSNVIFESDESHIIATYNSDPRYIFAEVNTDTTASILSESYENLLMPNSAPVERLFNANSDIVTYSLVASSNTAYVLTEEEMAQGVLPENPETDSYTIVAVAQKYMNNYGTIRSNIIVDGCAEGFLSSYLGNATFGNQAFTTALIRQLSDSTDTRQGLSISQTQINTIDITASASVMYMVGFILFTVLVPLAVLVVGLVIFLRRRHL